MNAGTITKTLITGAILAGIASYAPIMQGKAPAKWFTNQIDQGFQTPESHKMPAWRKTELQTASRLDRFNSELENISDGTFYGFNVDTNATRTANYGDTVSDFFGPDAFNLIRSNASYQGLKEAFEEVNGTSNLQSGNSYRIFSLGK